MSFCELLYSLGQFGFLHCCGCRLLLLLLACCRIFIYFLFLGLDLFLLWSTHRLLLWFFNFFGAMSHNMSFLPASVTFHFLHPVALGAILREMPLLFTGKTIYFLNRLGTGCSEMPCSLATMAYFLVFACWCNMPIFTTVIAETFYSKALIIGDWFGGGCSWCRVRRGECKEGDWLSSYQYWCCQLMKSSDHPYLLSINLQNILIS